MVTDLNRAVETFEKIERLMDDAKASEVKSFEDLIDPVIFATIVDGWATEKDPIKRLVYAMDFVLSLVPHEPSASAVDRVAKATRARMAEPEFDANAYWEETEGWGETWYPSRRDAVLAKS